MSNASKDFYVGIINPKEVRRNILEASKEFVQALQRYERVKEIRENKQKAVIELKEMIAGISATITALRTSLPDYKMSELPRKKTEKKEKINVSKMIMLPKQAKKTKKQKVVKQKQKIKIIKQIKPINPIKKTKKVIITRPKKIIKPRKEEKDIDRLQKELSTIESKLKGL